MHGLLSKGIPTLALGLILPASLALAAHTSERAIAPLPPPVLSGLGSGCWYQPGPAGGYMLGELRDEQGRVLYRLRGAVVDDGTERAVFQQGVVRGNVMEANTAKIVGHFFGTWVAGSGDGSFRADIRSTLEAKAPIGALVGRFRVPRASLETEKAIASPTKKQDPADQAKNADVAPGAVAIQILPDPTPKGALIMKWQLDHAL